MIPERDEQIRATMHGAVLLIEMVHEANRNAMGAEMTAAMRDALLQAAEPVVRSVVITGCGTTFSAGGDIKAMVSPMSRPDVEAKMRHLHETLVLPLATLPKPTIAAVNGVSAGAGIGLALACDFRVVSRDAYFMFAFHRLGLVPDFGLWWTLPRLIGMARANELAFLKSRLSAEEAESWGLVTELCDRETVLERALTMAGHLAAGPPIAMALTKQMIQSGPALTLHEALELEAVNQATARETDDHMGAVEAFVEKRTPTFEGR